MDFIKATSNDNWFKKNPQKIAGEEYETTSFFFPIMVRGTKEDVLRVTGMINTNSDLQLQIAIAEAEAAKAKLILL